MRRRVRQLRLTAEAQREVDTAADWYESRIAGLGFEFLRAFDAVCVAIARHPLGFEPG